MNKDLQRGIAKAREEKTAHARKLEEMRAEGTTTGDGDLARNIAAEKKLKSKQAVRAALKDK
ncbi:MAG: hypothetical protein HOJ41_11170 [Rhodospirillaceae bacterium]|nr:hypothetical protein [Rhodospirillaceae bacterium]